MSTPTTDLELRLSAALAARADAVQSTHLSVREAPVVPQHRRTPLLVLAAAACLLLAVVLTLMQGHDDGRVVPAPEPHDPELVFPPDVGRAWDRAKASPPVRLDLDGDGTDEKVRFLAEPSEDYVGRVRLQTTLSSDGSEAYGLVDVGTTLGLSRLDPIDADGDGDQEVVLFHEDYQGTGATVPVVLDLRDGVLVEAPASEPDLLQNGTVTAGGTEHYDMVHLVDYWVEDGTLYSERSVRSFADIGMAVHVPPEHESDAFIWQLGDDGVLRPQSAPQPCLRHVPEGRRACRPGETDALPVLAPVADDRIGIGESFSSGPGYRFEARLEEAGAAGADPTVVVEGDDGRRIEHQVRLGGEPQVFTQQPIGVFYDGASFVVAADAGDAMAMQVLVQWREELSALEPVGDVPLGTGSTDGDGRPFRTWLNQDGALLTAVADTADESGPWTVSLWQMLDRGSMVAVPLDTVCFDDATDPATARRC